MLLLDRCNSGAGGRSGLLAAIGGGRGGRWSRVAWSYTQLPATVTTDTGSSRQIGHRHAIIISHFTKHHLLSVALPPDINLTHINPLTFSTATFI